MNKVLFTKHSRLAAALSLFILISALFSGVASAQTAVACDANALIAAIAAANSTPAADTLNLAAGCTYSYSAANNNTDGPNALPVINGQLTINGNNATITRASGILRFFHIPAGATLSVNNINVTNGFASGGQYETRGRGGAFFNYGTLNITGAYFTNNTATTMGGVIMNYGLLNVAGAYFYRNNTTAATDSPYWSSGAGIGNDGAPATVNVTNSSFVENISLGFARYTGGGGIINYSGTINVSNVTFYRNGHNREGGAIAQYLSGTTNMTNITVIENYGVTNGGGVAIIAGTGNFRNSIFANNPLREDLFNAQVPLAAASGILWPATFDVTAGPDIDGIMNSQGYNLVKDHNKKLPPGFNIHYPAPTDIGPGIDPQLGALDTSVGLPVLPVLPGTPVVDYIPVGNCSASDQLGQPRAAAVEGGTVLCDIGAYEYNIPVVPPPAVVVSTQEPTLVDVNVAFCADLNGTINQVVRVSTAGIAWGIHCRMIAENSSFLRTSAEIGVQTVLDMGVIHAVDVFNAGDAAFPQQFSVCLAGVGSLVFLDAAGIPRVAQGLTSFTSGGFTCGNISSEGTVVLVAGAGLTVSAPAASAPITAQGVTLTDCRVTTTNILNLRAEASANAAVITQVPYNLTLNATERQGEWIKVIFESGQGFLNVGYLQLDGRCG